MRAHETSVRQLAPKETASSLGGAQTLIREAKQCLSQSLDIDLSQLAATMTEHGRLGCAPDNEAGEKGIDYER